MLALYTPIEIVELIAKKVEASRIEKNLTQKELALKAGITYGSYRNFLDLHKISLSSFLAILHTLDLLSEIEALTKIQKPQTIQELKEKSKVKKRVRKGS